MRRARARCLAPTGPGVGVVAPMRAAWTSSSRWRTRLPGSIGPSWVSVLIASRLSITWAAQHPGLLTWERAEAGVEGFDVHFRVMYRGRWRPECAIINALWAGCLGVGDHGCHDRPTGAADDDGPGRGAGRGGRGPARGLRRRRGVHPRQPDLRLVRW